LDKFYRIWLVKVENVCGYQMKLATKEVLKNIFYRDKTVFWRVGVKSILRASKHYAFWAVVSVFSCFN
jgi:hypothetical protein